MVHSDAKLILQRFTLSNDSHKGYNLAIFTLVYVSIFHSSPPPLGCDVTEKRYMVLVNIWRPWLYFDISQFIIINLTRYNNFNCTNMEAQFFNSYHYTVMCSEMVEEWFWIVWNLMWTNLAQPSQLATALVKLLI